MASGDQDEAQVLTVRYRFTFEQGRVREFQVRLRRDTLAMVTKPRDVYPAWTALAYHQCPNCPLPPTTPRCPAATNLVEVVESFKDDKSFERVDVEIITENRTYRKQVALQDGLSALVGIHMPTSGCPILDKLRPLVYTHLPFSSLQETTYRAVSMYCLAQYFRKLHGQEPDWELEGLARIYEEVVQVNSSFHLLILDVHVADAGLNALIQLDCYAQFTNRMLLRKGLGEIERLFPAYLGEA